MELDLRGESPCSFGSEAKALVIGTNDELELRSEVFDTVKYTSEDVLYKDFSSHGIRRVQRMLRRSIKNIYGQLKDTAINLSNNLNSPMSSASCIQWLGTTAAEITHKGTLTKQQRPKSKCRCERS